MTNPDTPKPQEAPRSMYACTECGNGWFAQVNDPQICEIGEFRAAVESVGGE